MANNIKIGAGLSLDGEKEFKSAVQGINKDLTVLGSEMKKVTSEFSGNANSMDALKAKTDVYNKQIDEQKKKVETLTNALENAKKEYGEGSDKVKNWQIQLNNAESQLNKTENALRETTEQAKKLDRAKFDGLVGGLKNAGAVAAKMALAIAAAGAAAAIGIGKMTLEAAAGADDINTLAKQTGMSTEEIQKFQYAAERIDVPMETLTKSMAKNIKSMAGVQLGTKEVTEAYAQLGIDVLNADGSLRDGQTVYNEVITALGGMENETQRDALAMQILGKSAQDLNPLILGGADALKQFGDEAMAAGLILDQDALDKLNLLNDAVDKMKATLTGAGSVFSTAFAGPLTEGINTITGYLERLGKAFTEGGLDGLSDELTTILSEVVGKIVEFMPTFIQLGIDLLGKIAIGIIQNIPTIVKAIPQIVGALVNALGGVGKELLNMGGSIIDGVWKGIAAKADSFRNKLKDFFAGIIRGVKSFLGIESPSKVFASIGENMALGLEGGFTGRMTAASGQINKSVPRSLDVQPYSMSFPQKAKSESINVTLQIDGQTLARQTFEHFRKETKSRGTPLVQGV